MKNYETIDEYLAGFSGEARKKLDILRETIHHTAPEASEKISYGIPTFYLNGNLLHFASYKNHIGFYPGAMPIRELKEELSGYHTSKGTIQFPLDKPLPLELIRKIVLTCVTRNKKTSANYRVGNVYR